MTIRLLLIIILIGVILATGCEAAGPTPPPMPSIPPSPAASTVSPVPSIPPTQAAPTATRVLPLAGTGGGMIAFVSTRDGNGEIYAMNADGSDQRRLTSYRQWDGFPSWSPDGTQIAYYSYLSDKSWVIKVMNADGSDQRQLTNGGGCDGAPFWSPDGAWIAYAADAGCNAKHREIYMMGTDGSNPRNLTNHPADDIHAVWSPDGSQIAFSSNRDGGYEIYVMNVIAALRGEDADSGSLRRLTNDNYDDYVTAWSPDGMQVAFFSNRDGNDEVYVMDVAGAEQGSGNLRRLTDDPAHDWFPAWSPDGTRIIFSSDRAGGNLDVYVMNADGMDVQRLTTARGEDLNAVWQH